jgi:CheY-like chemotaxis protein/two-component sensor histidine kinase
MATSRKLESLGVLAGGVAHDFSNLLVGILGRVQLAERTLPPGSASRQHLEDLRAAADQAAELTDQLLAFSGRGAFVQEELDLNRLILEFRRLLDAAVPKGVELRFELGDGLPGVMADATQLRQVLVNLVTNAADAIGTAGGTITVRTAVSGLAGRRLVLEVSDDGPGIPEDTVSRIFDPFFSTKQTGRGLGLAAAQGIVRGHGGTLVVESHAGQGTVFQARLPGLDHPVPQAAEPAAAQVAEPSLDTRAGGLILVVDDEVHVRRIMSLVLSEEGYDVLVAPGGVEALEMVAERIDEIHLVVLDLLMPGMGGEEVLAELYRQRPELPVVLTSGYAKEVAIRQIGDAGLAGFIKKPFRLEALIDLVNGLLRA